MHTLWVNVHARVKWRIYLLGSVWRLHLFFAENNSMLTQLTGNKAKYSIKVLLWKSCSSIMKPNCHYWESCASIMKPKCHYWESCSSIRKPNCHYWESCSSIMKPNCHYWESCSSIMKPNCHYWDSCSGIMKPNCHYCESCSSIMKPNCHYWDSCFGIMKPNHSITFIGSVSVLTPQLYKSMNNILKIGYRIPVPQTK